MTYAHDHLLVTFGGPIGTREQWQCGFRMGHVGSDYYPAEFATLEEADFDGIGTWHISGANGAAIGSPAKLTWVKAALIGKDGRYVVDAKTWGKNQMTGQTSPLPFQACYAVTLWDGASVGKHHRGRFYVPLPTFLVGQSDGLMSEAQAQGAQQAAHNMLTAVKTAVNARTPSVEVVIASAVGSGTQNVVSKIGVGRVLDTQRRRREALNDAKNYIDF